MTRNGVVAVGSMVGFFSVTPLGMLRLCPDLSGGDSANSKEGKGQLVEHTGPQGSIGMDVNCGDVRHGFLLSDALAKKLRRACSCSTGSLVHVSTTGLSYSQWHPREAGVTTPPILEIGKENRYRS